jgi:hypothetical protein
MGLFSKLQNGDTVLKSLKFGKDRPGGGDSGQPYIKNPLIDEPGKLSRVDDDFLLRGGLRAPINAVEDVARLTKYMFDFKSPKGLMFIAKQNLLSRVSVATEASISAGYGNNPSKELAWTKAPLNQGIYTPLSTILQAGIGFTGTHLNLLGINPFTPMTGIVQGGFLPGIGLIRYEDVIRGETRLTKTIEVDKWVINPKPAKAVPGIDGSASTGNYNKIKVKEKQKVPIGQYENRLIYLWGKDMTNTDNAGGTVLTYSGGPGSVLGIGKTKIKFADQRTGLNNSLSSTEFKYFYEGGNRLHEFDSFYQWKLPIAASSKYIDYTKSFVPYDLIKGNNSYEETTLKRLLKPGTLEPNMELTGSNGYQSNRLLALISHSGSQTYTSPINTILNEFGTDDSRQLIVNPIYDPNIGTFTPQDTEGKNLGAYSSKNTLWNEGYLANLEKNAKPFITENRDYTFSLVQYPRSIAPDFRKTNRKTRGFTDINTTYNSSGSLPGSYDIITTSGSDYTSSDSKIIDKIYYSSATERTSNAIDSGNDLIDFKITIIDPRNPTNSTIPLKFRAYIDSFSDSYTADWKGQTYMGRAESFYKYNSFGRDMSLSFKIVADNKSNLNIMYNQLNTLASSLAPTYTEYGYMAGNLHQLTVGNYVSNQTGIMNSLSYEIIDESPWEIETGDQLPMYIAVNIKFTPIHNFRPEMKWSDGTRHQFINQA